MRRSRVIILAFTALLHAPDALGQGATAIRGDGTIVEVRESELAELGERSWPDWKGMWVGPSVPQAQVTGSAMCMQDGQVLVGGFEPNGAELWWRNAKIGAFRVDLERIHRIGPLVVESAPSANRDEVHFLNGDRAQGFIQSIDATHGVRLAPITDAGAPATSVVDHDLERVVAVWLATRPEPATGWRFWLRDGSVIDADHWTREGEGIVLESCHLAGSPPRVPVDWSQVIAIRSAPAAILPLAAQAWRSSDVPQTPRLSPARCRVESGSHPLDLSPIDFHGPGTFETTVPAGEWTLSALLCVPPGLSGKVTCTAIVLDGDSEVLRFPIHASAESMPLHAVIRSGRLVIRIEESGRGAFGAALRMVRPFRIPITRGSLEPTPQHSSGTVNPDPQDR